MDEWAACVDAITFIFQARTTPINNEKEKNEEGVRRQTKSKRARHIYMHTSRSRNSARANLWACACVYG
jgi:hypothetical protein